MSSATDFLTEWIGKAAVRAPSITRTTTQRWPNVGTPPHFKPGITSYGWGINGSTVKNPAGSPIGLQFGGISVWFSDRGQDLSNPPPNSGDQFQGNKSDTEQMTFTIAGDTVQLDVHSVTWNSKYTAYSTSADGPSQQLIFSDVPAAGPDPVRALLVVSFADTGQFGWL